MSWILNKNTIMTGYVDSFCLACEAHLRSDEDAILHVVKPIHKKNLDATSYLDKYRKEHVRKVKKGYYCEFCNLFMKTAAKVGPHIAEPKHIENKAALLLKREGNGVLAFDKLLISENAWHGLIEDTCAVCDSEFDNAQIHKTETGHILNLVMIEIVFADGDNVYRKVDESTFQCLTCNMVYAQNAIPEHFSDPQHKDRYQKCCEAANNRVDEPKKETEVSEEEKSMNTEKDKKKDTVKKSPEHEIPKEDKSKKTADAVKPKEEPKKAPNSVKPKEEPKKAPEPEKKQEANKGKPTESCLYRDKMGKTDKDICNTLGADNYIVKDVCGKHWCILCDWAMDGPTVQSHLFSNHHQTLLKMHKKRQEEKAQESKSESDDPNNDVDPKAASNSKILDLADEFQKNDMKLDFVAGSAYCRICAKSIDFDVDDIKNHIMEHKRNPANAIKNDIKSERTSAPTSPVRKNEKTREKESRASSVASNRELDVEVENYAKQHELTYNRDNNNVFCRVCVTKVPASIQNMKEHVNGIIHKSRVATVASNKECEVEIENYAKQHELTCNRDNNNAFCRVCLTKVPASIKNMKEHVNGISHKNKVAKVDVKPSVTVMVKRASHDFIDSILTIENMFCKDIVINEKYCVNIYSFVMLTRIREDARSGRRLRCQACEVTLPMHMIDEHKRTPRHERTMNDAPVISSEESEFIREIRPNIFHCGFCNQLEASWRLMESHLKSTAHREAKTAANWRLQEYAPDIIQHKARQHMEFMLFSRMLMGEMFGSD